MPSSPLSAVSGGIEWLREADKGRLPVTGKNVWQALKLGAYIQVLDHTGGVLHEVKRLDSCAGFRVTQRGRDLIEGRDKTKAVLPFNKEDPPLNIRLWVSAFRRWMRNCPQGLSVVESDGEMHVLAKDTEGKVENDLDHRLASVKAPWQVIKK